jgi:glutamate-5-semialdehyde dehydrogenase
MSLTECSAPEIATSASLASRRLATLSTESRNNALTALHSALLENREHILEANARDVSLATRAAEDGKLSQSVLKRLDLSRPGKYQDMLDGILSVRDLEDPSMFEGTENHEGSN